MYGRPYSCCDGDKELYFPTYILEGNYKKVDFYTCFFINAFMGNLLC